MSSQNTPTKSTPSSIFKISERAFGEINDLMKNQFENDEIEIIFAISKSGEVSILEGRSERRFLITDNCTGKNQILTAPNESCDETRFAVGEFVASEADEELVKEFTVGKIVKAVVPLGITLYTESGCSCNSRRCTHWD
jgi:hypothetical protein